MSRKEASACSRRLSNRSRSPRLLRARSEFGAIAAARQVCAPLDERPLKRVELFDACVADALSTAVAKVGQPLLSSYYHAKLDGRSAGHPETYAHSAPGKLK